MSEHGYGRGPDAERGPSDAAPTGPPPHQGHVEPTAGATTPLPPATPESAATRPTPPAGEPYAPPASQYDARQHTILPVKGAGGVSAARSELEGAYAWSWARNIWADMLT